MSRCRSHNSLELAILYPRRIEHLDLAQAVGEHHARAVPVEAVIDERLLWFLSFRPRQHLARGAKPVQKAVAHRREREKSAAPGCVVCQRFRIKAAAKLTFFSQSHAN